MGWAHVHYRGDRGAREETAQVSTSACLTSPHLGAHASWGTDRPRFVSDPHTCTRVERTPTTAGRQGIPSVRARVSVAEGQSWETVSEAPRLSSAHTDVCAVRSWRPGEAGGGW